MKKVDIFTDFLYEEDCPQDILDIALDHAKKSTYYWGKKNSTSYPEQFFGDEFDPVREWVDSKLAEVHKDRDWEFDELKSTVFWTTMSTKGQWHHGHCHGLSMVSGIIYLTPSGSETWFSRESIWGPEHLFLPLHKDQDKVLLYAQAEDRGRKVHTLPLSTLSQRHRARPGRTKAFPLVQCLPIRSNRKLFRQASRRLLNITVNQKQ